MGDTDPFLSVKEEVEQSLKQSEKLYARWQQMLEKISNGGGDKEELDYTTKEVLNGLKSIGWDLEDLSETISIVEASPARFKIDQTEIAARKRFVDQTQRRTNEIKNHVTGSETKQKIASGARSALMSGGTGPASRYAKLEKEAEERNSEFIEDQSQKQQQIIREQDKQLTEVGSSIGVLKTMGTAIGNELEDQNRLLDELDHELETTQDRLKRTIQRVDKVLGISKDGKQSCCICLLILILIILIIVYVS
eukprot:m.20614 g.20614  ORF g.20614 m.20614 type:complete len:251 (+) comp6897_c0_seq1:305-1057(+)